MLSSALTYLDQLIPNKQEPLIVGVSGGVDSMVLLHLLSRQGYGNIHVCHLNHHIREEAKHDALLVRNTALQYGMSYHEKECSISTLARERKQTIEQTGREERYHFFEEIRKKEKAHWILVAHHEDDLMESQLLHLQRGAGIFGLVGFRVQDKERNITRPLIDCRKNEIYSYAQHHGLLWNEDQTNHNDSYTRNYIRHHIVPGLQKKFPDLRKICKELSDTSESILSRMYKEIEHVLGIQFETKRSWNIKDLLALPKEYLSHAILFILRYQHPNYHYTQGMVDNVVKLLPIISSGQEITVHKHCTLVRNFDMLAYKDEQTSIRYSASTFTSISYDLCRVGDQSFFLSQKSSGSLTSVPRKHIAHGYTLRTRRPGDYVTLKQRERVYHKSLKKYFIEQRIPKHLRDQVILLTGVENGEIFAILDPGVYYTYPDDLQSEKVYIHAQT